MTTKQPVAFYELTAGSLFGPPVTWDLGCPRRSPPADGPVCERSALTLAMPRFFLLRHLGSFTWQPCWLRTWLSYPTGAFGGLRRRAELTRRRSAANPCQAPSAQHGQIYRQPKFFMAHWQGRIWAGISVQPKGSCSWNASLNLLSFPIYRGLYGGGVTWHRAAWELRFVHRRTDWHRCFQWHTVDVTLLLCLSMWPAQWLVLYQL